MVSSPAALNPTEVGVCRISTCLPGMRFSGMLVNWRRGPVRRRGPEQHQAVHRCRHRRLGASRAGVAGFNFWANCGSCAADNDGNWGSSPV